MAGQVQGPNGNGGPQGAGGGNDANAENAQLEATFQQIAAEQMRTTEISAKGSSAVHTAEQGPHA